MLSVSAPSMEAYDGLCHITIETEEEDMPLHQIAINVKPEGQGWFTLALLNDSSATWALGNACEINGAIVQVALSPKLILLSIAQGGGEVNVNVALDTEEASVSLTLDRSPGLTLNISSPVDSHLSPGPQGQPGSDVIVLRLV
jgi:hypothetical protein